MDNNTLDQKEVDRYNEIDRIMEKLDKLKANSQATEIELRLRERKQQLILKLTGWDKPILCLGSSLY